MARLKILAAVAAAVLIFTSPAAFATMADGLYSRHFMSGEVPVWDISGSYSDSGFGDFIINEDPSGALTGTGTLNIDDGFGTVLNGTLIPTGKVKSAGTATKVSLKFLVSNGTGTFVDDQGFSHDVTFTGTINTNSDVDGIDSELVLTSGKITLKLQEPSTGRKGSASDTLNPGGTLDLPSGTTGDWDLTMTLMPDGTKYTGPVPSTVDTSNGGTTDFTATGSYTSKTDTSKITLKGPKGTGASLNLLISTVGSNMTVNSVKGKLYGQSIKFTAPP